MEDNFDLKKYIIESKIAGTQSGFEKFKSLVKGILDDNANLRDFDEIVTIEGLIEFWAREAEDEFYNHTQEDMVALSKEADLDFGDREALLNTDEVNSLERGGIEDEDEELNEDLEDESIEGHGGGRLKIGQKVKVVDRTNHPKAGKVGEIISLSMEYNDAHVEFEDGTSSEFNGDTLTSRWR